MPSSSMWRNRAGTSSSSRVSTVVSVRLSSLMRRTRKRPSTHQ